jgi:hypothetical protein
MFNDPYLLSNNNMRENRTLVEKIVRIRDESSPDLAFRDSALEFFKKLENMREKEIQIDFSNIQSISRSFAHEYIVRKTQSTKDITEINLPDNVEKMFRVVTSRSRLLDSSSMEVETI